MAGIDVVCGFFEQRVAAVVPETDVDRPFVLLGEHDGQLKDQPLNQQFYRKFDVIWNMDGEEEESHLPLHRRGTLLVQVGYLGSVKSRYWRKIMRQDEEAITVAVIQEVGTPIAPANRPYEWGFLACLPQDLDDSGSASILNITYRVQFVTGNL